jgi:hypothetical protein
MSDGARPAQEEASKDHQGEAEAEEGGATSPHPDPGRKAQEEVEVVYTDGTTGYFIPPTDEEIAARDEWISTQWATFQEYVAKLVV